MSDSDTIYHYLLAQIDQARGLPVKLDSEHRLATRFGVSRWVARRVLQRLAREGHAVVNPGRGYFARSASSDSANKRVRVGIVYRPEGTAGYARCAVASQFERGDHIWRKRGMVEKEKGFGKITGILYSGRGYNGGWRRVTWSVLRGFDSRNVLAGKSSILLRCGGVDLS